MSLISCENLKHVIFIKHYKLVLIKYSVIYFFLGTDINVHSLILNFINDVNIFAWH